MNLGESMENEEIEILEEFDENEKIKKADINNENKYSLDKEYLIILFLTIITVIILFLMIITKK